MNRLVLTGLLLIVALHAFDEFVLLIALPTIADSLGSAQWYGIVIASYILASIVGAMWSGSRIDERGPLHVFQIAAGCFASGLVITVFAETTSTFIIARLLQGFGGGVAWTFSFALINLLCRDDQKSGAIAALDIAWVLPSLIAPSIGGWLVDYWHWHWIFIIQLPVLFIAYLFIAPRIKQLAKPACPINWKIIIDALRVAFGTAAMLYIIATPLSWVWLLIPIMLFVSMAPYNRFMPKDWWQLKTPLSIAIAVATPAFIILYGIEAYLPLYLIEARDLSSINAGFVLSTASIGWMLGSMLQVKVQHRLSAHKAMIVGFSGMTFSVVLMLLVINYPTISAYWCYPIWALTGVGMGIAFNAARTSALYNTEKNQDGATATSITLAANLGVGLASGVGGAMKNHILAAGGTLDDTMQAICLLAIAAGIVLIIMLFRRLSFIQNSTSTQLSNQESS